MYVDYDLSNPTNKANKIIKVFMARIEYRKYTSIHQANITIHPKKSENYNDRMWIYSISIVRIHKHKFNIAHESRTSVVSEFKQLSGMN
jgi:general stress protein CsbA